MAALRARAAADTDADAGATADTDADVEVFVGSTTNAGALGEHLRRRGRSVHLVSSGSKGDVAVEDHSATLVSRSSTAFPSPRRSCFAAN